MYARVVTNQIQAGKMDQWLALVGDACARAPIRLAGGLERSGRVRPAGETLCMSGGSTGLPVLPWLLRVGVNAYRGAGAVGAARRWRGGLPGSRWAGGCRRWP